MHEEIVAGIGAMLASCKPTTQLAIVGGVLLAIVVLIIIGLLS